MANRPNPNPTPAAPVEPIEKLILVRGAGPLVKIPYWLMDFAGLSAGAIHLYGVLRSQITKPRCMTVPEIAAWFGQTREEVLKLIAELYAASIVAEENPDTELGEPVFPPQMVQYLNVYHTPQETSAT